MVEIIKVLGTPTRDLIHSMNPNYSEFKFPAIKPNSWQKVFKSRTPVEAVDLISKLLVYNPERRLNPVEALAHPFFDELREQGTRLPNGSPLPDLFDFHKEEITSTTASIMKILIPEWYVARDSND